MCEKWWGEGLRIAGAGPAEQCGKLSVLCRPRCAPSTSGHPRWAVQGTQGIT